MGRFLSVTGEPIEAIKILPGMRDAVAAFVGTDRAAVPSYGLWEWLVRHQDGCITAMSDPDFWHLYQPTDAIANQ